MKILPRVQIVLVVLFAALVMCGPAVFLETRTLLLSAAGLGIILGLVTLRIGWRSVIQKQVVDYPFAEWSFQILKFVLQPGQARALKASRRDHAERVQKVLGYASLTAGAVLVIGMLIVAVLVLTSL